MNRRESLKLIFAGVGGALAKLPVAGAVKAGGNSIEVQAITKFMGSLCFHSNVEGMYDYQGKLIERESFKGDFTDFSMQRRMSKLDRSDWLKAKLELKKILGEGDFELERDLDFAVQEAERFYNAWEGLPENQRLGFLGELKKLASNTTEEVICNHQRTEKLVQEQSWGADRAKAERKDRGQKRGFEFDFNDLASARKAWGGRIADKSTSCESYNR